MDGAITEWANTRSVEPARSRSTWSIWEAPTSIAATNVHTLRPGCAPPTRPPNRTVRSTKPSKPKRSINVPAANNPASATSPSSSKTASYRSIFCNTPLTGSASRLRANHHVSYGYCPRSEALSASIHPQPQNIYRWIQAKPLPRKSPTLASAAHYIPGQNRPQPLMIFEPPVTGLKHPKPRPPVR